MSDSLRPYELQHTRPPFPSPTPGVHSDSCLSSRRCHPAISSSVIPFFSRPQSLSASQFFPMIQLFAWGGRSTGVSALASFLPKNTLMVESEEELKSLLMWRANLLEKTPMLGKSEGRRRRGWQRMRWWMTSPTQWTWVWASSRIADGQGSLVCYNPWGCKESDMAERLNWTNSYLIITIIVILFYMRYAYRSKIITVLVC